MDGKKPGRQSEVEEFDGVPGQYLRPGADHAGNTDDPNIIRQGPYIRLSISAAKYGPYPLSGSEMKDEDREVLSLLTEDF